VKITLVHKNGSVRTAMCSYGYRMRTSDSVEAIIWRRRSACLRANSAASELYVDRERLIAHNDLSQFYLANGLDLISEIEARRGPGETNV
jgi:hypothetical protein